MAIRQVVDMLTDAFSSDKGMKLVLPRRICSKDSWLATVFIRAPVELVWPLKVPGQRCVA